MDLFKLDKHNYWSRHINAIWAESQSGNSLVVQQYSLKNQYARDLLLLFFELMTNSGELLYVRDLDHIPINTGDMQVVNLLFNAFFQANGLNHRIEISGGGIRLTN